MNLLCVDVQDLKDILDRGNKLPFPDGILINGRGPNGYYLTVEQGIYPMVKPKLIFSCLSQYIINCIIHYRENLQAQNIKCWTAKFTQLPHSKP